MKKIEGVILAAEFDHIRDALRKMGIRTVRVMEVPHQKESDHRSSVGGKTDPDQEFPWRVKMSIVVPDDLADRAILTLLASARKGQILDADNSISAIERVVWVENEGPFDLIV